MRAVDWFALVSCGARAGEGAVRRRLARTDDGVVRCLRCVTQRLVLFFFFECRVAFQVSTAACCVVRVSATRFHSNVQVLNSDAEEAHEDLKVSPLQHSFFSTLLIQSTAVETYSYGNLVIASFSVVFLLCYLFSSGSPRRFPDILATRCRV